MFTNAIEACHIPELGLLHPYAVHALLLWWQELLNDNDFLRLITLVDSDNLRWGECLVKWVQI